MAAPIRNMFRPVILVVVGATGTGKSKLAIELATTFNGEIISADSMQVYKGLDIVTNKVSSADRASCPHHLLDFVSPIKSNYTVADFRDASLPVIDDIVRREKLPIIVGGTNYYIESLLWKFLLDSSSEAQNDNPLVSETCSQTKLSFTERYSGRRTEDLMLELKIVDSESAHKIHPKDRRKILSALEVYHTTGVKKSDHLAAQHIETGSLAMSGSQRYANTCMIWVQCQQKELDERINKRVDEMVSAGLVDELSKFHSDYNLSRLSDNKEADYTLGIFQTIGFKEFHSYLTMSEDLKHSESGLKLLESAIDEVKRATRQYARKQLKWINNRFVKRRDVSAPPIYTVDSTDPQLWQSDVYQRAVHIVSCFLRGSSCSIEPLSQQPNPNKHVYHKCQDCDLTFVTLVDWQAHISGHRHKKTVASRRRLEKYRLELSLEKSNHINEAKEEVLLTSVSQLSSEGQCNQILSVSQTDTNSLVSRMPED